ncbi:hypothetical protein ABEG18_07950 [Alsobacter sp. KACC 23698]|uniref:Uncharacterized protein n=1 Tax=Alsobacter sp. KACC 23698 TaxID=3149229 RepID=A0AAU7JKK1_9HYPH
MKETNSRQVEGAPDASLSRHILPTSGTMIGICTTLVGLVKIIEARTGPSSVDELAALTSILFLASAVMSYASIRTGRPHRLGVRLERAADLCFMVGLVSVVAIAAFFAYEVL